MDISKLMPLLLKGLGVAQVLQNQGQSVAPAYRAVRVLLKKAEAGSVTDDDLAETESDLDNQMRRFNRPI